MRVCNYCAILIFSAATLLSALSSGCAKSVPTSNHTTVSSESKTMDLPKEALVIPNDEEGKLLQVIADRFKLRIVAPANNKKIVSYLRIVSKSSKMNADEFIKGLSNKIGRAHV